MKDGVLYWDEYSNRDEVPNELVNIYIESSSVVDKGGGSEATFNYIVDEEDIPDSEKMSARNAISLLSAQVAILRKELDNKT